MSLATWTFLENTPAAAGIAISSQAIAGSPTLSPIQGILSSAALDEAESLKIVARITGAANGTLDIGIQTMSDENTWDDQVRFPLTVAGAPTYHLTFSLTRGFPSGMTTIGSVGISDAAVNSPVMLLSQGTFINGSWGNKWRIVMVAGVGTTAAAVLKMRISAQAGTIRRNG